MEIITEYTVEASPRKLKICTSGHFHYCFNGAEITTYIII